MPHRFLLKIKGMHCASCKTLIEETVGEMRGVLSVEVDYPGGETKLEINKKKTNPEKIISEIKKLGYEANFLKPSNKESEAKRSLNDSDDDGFEIKAIKYIGLFLGIIILVGAYFVLQKVGAFQIFSRLGESNVGYGLIFLLGVLASFHCVGMCGGLVVAYSTQCCGEKSDSTLEKRKANFWPHVLYNLGRVASYTLVGAILGGIGSFFGINPNFSGFLTIFVAIFMMIMGISLIKRIDFIEKIKSKMPSFIARYLFSQKATDKPRGPLIIGFLNGLMPCGPLQAVQFYALGTGSVTRGALSMFFYALGTVFLMFGFGYFISSISSKKVKKMMIFSGVLVLILGAVMLNRGLSNFGLGTRSFRTTDNIIEQEDKNDNKDNIQVVNMDLTYRGYLPNVLYIKKGIPVHWVINVKQMSGCTDAIIMEKFNIRKNLKKGQNIIEFTPTKTGEIPFSCWMKMVWGKFIVTD